jgi:hypothetical protein
MQCIYFIIIREEVAHSRLFYLQFILPNSHVKCTLFTFADLFKFQINKFETAQVEFIYIRFIDTFIHVINNRIQYIYIIFSRVLVTIIGVWIGE